MPLKKERREDFGPRPLRGPGDPPPSDDVDDRPTNAEFGRMMEQIEQHDNVKTHDVAEHLRRCGIRDFNSLPLPTSPCLYSSNSGKTFYWGIKCHQHDVWVNKRHVYEHHRGLMTERGMAEAKKEIADENKAAADKKKTDKARLDEHLRAIVDETRIVEDQELASCVGYPGDGPFLANGGARQVPGLKGFRCIDNTMYCLKHKNWRGWHVMVDAQHLASKHQKEEFSEAAWTWLTEGTELFLAKPM